jgi:hypothetical protein
MQWQPQQSFRFRFADFETRKLCLFINDLYNVTLLHCIDSSHGINSPETGAGFCCFALSIIFAPLYHSHTE